MENEGKVIGIMDNMRIEENGDGTFDFELSEGFVTWFKNYKGLKRFSKKAFEKFVIEALTDMLDREEKKLVTPEIEEQKE